MRARLLSTLAVSLIFGAVLGSAADGTAAHGADFVHAQRVRFAPHVMDRPHWHPNDRHVTVRRGTWFTGTGATFAPSQAVPLEPGSYILHPAKALHWDGSNSDEEVIVQIFGIGPAGTVPADLSQPFWVRVQP